MEWTFGEYKISTDKSMLSLGKIAEFLSKSYWASDRPLSTIEKSLKNSECFGVYCGDEQVGFARVISDFATFYWIGDVYIDERHRGKGLGKLLVKCIVEMDELRNVSGILATKDAHGLYRQFGFEDVEAGRIMRRKI